MCPDHSKCTQAHPSYTVEDSYANSTHKLLFCERGKRWIWPLCFLLGERKRKKVQKPSFGRPLLFLSLLLVSGYVPYDVWISSTWNRVKYLPLNKEKFAIGTWVLRTALSKERVDLSVYAVVIFSNVQNHGKKLLWLQFSQFLQI